MTAAGCGCEGCAARAGCLPEEQRAGRGGERLLTVGQAARAAGVTASALRFYESQALVVPATRSSNGYRLYAAEQVEQVQFLRRAQRLGLRLAEVGELLAAADGGEAPGAREQLRDLVKHKIQMVRRQADELQELAAQLESVHRRLAGAPGSNCSSHVTACGCLSVEPVATAG